MLKTGPGTFVQKLEYRKRLPFISAICRDIRRDFIENRDPKPQGEPPGFTEIALLHQILKDDAAGYFISGLNLSESGIASTSQDNGHIASESQAPESAAGKNN